MIGYLEGIWRRQSDDSALVICSGVGYLVHTHSRMIASYSNNEPVALRISTIMNESNISLYGFADELEQTMFNDLITVKGVGPRLAMVILGVLPPFRLQQAITSGDNVVLKAISGVGPKLVERLIVELKSKMAKYPAATIVEPNTNNTVTPVVSDAVAALMSLGYIKTEAEQVVMKHVNDNPDLPLEILIKQSLQELS